MATLTFARRHAAAAVALKLLIAAQAMGQVPLPGNCELGQSEADIDVGDVRARVFNTGALFFGNTTQAGYIVPAATGRTPIFASNLWVGGFVAGEFRMAGAAYANWEFWPGPLAPGAATPTSAECEAHDRLWKVSRGDIERYYATGEATTDLLEWPHHLGAPVLDGDGDADNYNLEGGDQPAVWGDQTIWWVMNDVGNVHTESLTPPIGLEVQVTAFGVARGPAALRQATFYRYVLINRSGATLDSAYVGFYTDADLGDAADDYVGTDTSRALGYWYNAGNQDGTGEGGTYGLAPPAAGVHVLATPTGSPNGRDDDRDGQIDEPDEELGMSYTSCHAKNQGFPFQEPQNGTERYFCLQGRWLDGSPITEGGQGIGGPGPVMRYLFPADPVQNEYWSEPCPNQPCGQANQPFDHRLGVSSGPFALAPGTEETFYIGILFGQGIDNLDSINELRRVATISRNAFESGHLEPRLVPGAPGPTPVRRIEVERPAPNPIVGSAVIRYTLPGEASVRVAVVDILGREVAVLSDGAADSGTHARTIDATDLAPGVYAVRLWVNGQPAAAMLVTVAR